MKTLAFICGCLLVALCFACSHGANTVPTAQQEQHGWTQDQTAQFVTRCHERWSATNISEHIINGYCDCMASSIASRWSFSWLTDGRPMDNLEVESLHGMIRSCLNDVGAGVSGT